MGAWVSSPVASGFSKAGAGDCSFRFLDARLLPHRNAAAATSSAHGKRVDRRQIGELQLHPLGSLPAIDAQRSGRVDGLAAALDERIAKLLARRPEGDGREDGAITRLEPSPYVRLPDRLCINDRMGRQ